MEYGIAIRKLEDLLEKFGLELINNKIKIVNYALKWIEYPVGNKLITIGMEDKNNNIIFISKLDKNGCIKETLTLEEYFR